MSTRWESEADLRAPEASGWFQEEARGQVVLGAPPNREHCEVRVTVGAAPPEVAGPRLPSR